MSFLVEVYEKRNNQRGADLHFSLRELQELQHALKGRKTFGNTVIVIEEAIRRLEISKTPTPEDFHVRKK